VRPAESDVEADDPPERAEAFKRIHANDLARRFGYHGTRGVRNQHMMTGRVC
jgi:hypothetical protein